MNDHRGARVILYALPQATSLIADRGYDSNWFRTALIEKGIKRCFPPTRSRKRPIPYDKTLYRQRHRIENMFGRLRDWRRSATRYEMRPHLLLSNLHRGYCSLLSQSMSPEPSLACEDGDRRTMRTDRNRDTGMLGVSASGQNHSQFRCDPRLAGCDECCGKSDAEALDAPDNHFRSGNSNNTDPSVSLAQLWTLIASAASHASREACSISGGISPIVSWLETG
jgi:transposase